MRNRITKALVVALAVVATVSSRSALAQTFKTVSVQNNVKMAQIASGGMSVWGLGTNGHPYIFKGGSFVKASTISLTQIAVGGGNVGQPDAVWALDLAHNIYKAVKSGNTYSFNQIPGSLDTIAVGVGYQDSCHPYEVWGLSPYVVGLLNSSGILRFDFCKSDWDQIPGMLGSLAVGGGDVWGTDGNNEVFGLDFASMTFQLFNVAASQVAAAPEGAWGTLYVSEQDETLILRTDSNHGFLSGDIIGITPGSLTLLAGGDGVWGINPSGQVFVYRYAYNGFLQIPGIVLTSLSVGSGGGVWGIDGNGQVYVFSTL